MWEGRRRLRERERHRRQESRELQDGSLEVALRVGGRFELNPVATRLGRRGKGGSIRERPAISGAYRVGPHAPYPCLQSLTKAAARKRTGDTLIGQFT